MSSVKSPVEKRIELLRDLWMDATEDDKVRVVVFRIPGNADRMLQAFFEAQRHDGDWQTPDLFLKFDASFETGFTYSRMLREALVNGYTASEESFKEQGIPFDWPFAELKPVDSAAGFFACVKSFAAHHQSQFRYAAAVLSPPSVTSSGALKAWIEAGLKDSLSANVRLVLVDYTSEPQWDWVATAYGRQVHVIQAPLDMFDIARETAAQSGSSGPAVVYRQMLTDVIALVENGTPTQVTARASKALDIAQREKWFDQQVVVHMAVAGAHLKAKDCAAAIASYRNARASAQEAVINNHPVGGNLVMQTWFGEAGAWLMDKKLQHAAQAYRCGAEEAQRMPNHMFALEGFRMAAYCYAQDGDASNSRIHGGLALVEGKAMKPEERPLSTLGFALQDQLKLYDPSRAAKLEKLAAAYQSEIAGAHAKAETRAAALGQQPSAEAVQQVEADMHRSFEVAFQNLREQRERLIERGDSFFQKVTAIGRELLHPDWAGLPEVKHPLDTAQAEWTTVPQCVQLPPVDDLSLAHPGAELKCPEEIV